MTKALAKRMGSGALAFLLALSLVCFVPGTAWAVAGSSPLMAGSVDFEALNTQAENVQETSDVPMYRLCNPWSGEHLYTADKNEREVLCKRDGWYYEGISWLAPKEGDNVYRLYNPSSGEHLYTLDANEKNVLNRRGWRYEGIGWKSAVASDAGKSPVYRLYHPWAAAISSHHFTTDTYERSVLLRSGWRDEKVGWYGHSVPANYPDDRTPWKANISGDTSLDWELGKILFNHKSLASCFNYVKGFPYRNGTRFWGNPRVLANGTTIPMAKSMIGNYGGNCYQYASLLCWLARGLGYNAQVISGWVQSTGGGQAPHGWVEIDVKGTKYVCDPCMAHSLPGYNWYMVTYGSSPIVYHNW